MGDSVRIILIPIQFHLPVHLKQPVNAPVLQGGQSRAAAVGDSKICVQALHQHLPLSLGISSGQAEDTVLPGSHQGTVLQGCQFHTAGTSSKDKDIVAGAAGGKGNHSPILGTALRPFFNLSAGSIRRAQIDIFTVGDNAALIDRDVGVALQHPAVLPGVKIQRRIGNGYQSAVVQGGKSLYHLISAPFLIGGGPLLGRDLLGRVSPAFPQAAHKGIRPLLHITCI